MTPVQKFLVPPVTFKTTIYYISNLRQGYITLVQSIKILKILIVFLQIIKIETLIV